MKTPASQFLAGFLAPFVGALMIANRRPLLRLAILPFTITVLIFIVGLAFGLPWITRYVDPFTTSTLSFFGVKLTSNAGEFLSWLLPFLIWPALALALVYLLLTLTRLVAAPFYGLLAERVLRDGGVLETRRKWREWLVVNARQARMALIKTLLFLLMGLVLGLISFVPGCGIFTSFAFLILLAYDVVDYALEALGLTFERRIEFFRRHFFVFLGLGLSLGLVFLMPGLNFFVLPASVCGASDVVRRMIRD